jgi:ATP-binding cassette subfamily B protein
MSEKKSQKPADTSRSSGQAARLRLLPRGSRTSITLVSLLVGCEAAFACFAPVAVRYFIETVMKSFDNSALWPLLIVLLVAFAVSLGAGFLRDYLFAGLRSRSLAGMRRSMFRRLQSLSMQFHANLDRQQMLERFSSDLAIVDNALSLAVSWGVLPLISAVLCTGLMLWLDWRVGLIALILWPWAMLAPRAMTPRSASALQESRKHETHVLGLVEESLVAQALIRAFAIESLGAAAFRTRNEALARSAAKAGIWSAFVERFTGIGIQVEQALVLLVSLWLAFSREMTIGTLVSLQMLAAILGSSLLYLSEYMPELLSGQAAFKEIQESLQESSTVADAADAKVFRAFTSEIVFSDVSCESDREGFVDETARRESGLGPDHSSVKPVPHSVLEHVSIRIPKGSYVALVGASGAGKSLMLNLLMRFRDPDSGRVTIDGHDLRHLTQASLRSRIGVVLQDGFVFNSTIRENIRMGRPTATEEAINDAAREAGLYDYIQTLPQGLDTTVGSSGEWLSGEMTQRLALARAVLRKPDILLLDEISSALDPAEEQAINKTLEKLAQTTTVISVTHRLASVAHAGQIFMFDHGKMVEQGNHFELMALNGSYASLWHKQAGFRFSPDGRHVDVDAQRLQTIPILEKLDEPFLAELAPYFATETFEMGREIVCQNDPGDKFYIIARGKVEVWRTEERSGSSLCVGVLNDGDFFGEITLITGFPRTATVRTVAVTTCISLVRGQFTKLIDRFPDLKKELSEIAVQRLRNSSRMAIASR